MEWTFGAIEAEAVITLSSGAAGRSRTNTATMGQSEKALDLSASNHWQWLAKASNSLAAASFQNPGNRAGLYSQTCIAGRLILPTGADTIPQSADSATKYPALRPRAKRPIPDRIIRPLYCLRHANR